MSAVTAGLARVPPIAWAKAALDEAQEAPPDIAPAASRAASTLSVATLLAVAVASALLPAGGSAVVGWVALAAGLVIGLPHGAVDHLVPEWLLGRRVPLRTMIVLLLAYVGTAAAFFAAMTLAPAPAGLVFLVVSVLHFGCGDVAFTAARASRAPRFRPHLVLGFGAPPLLLPVALWPEPARAVLEGFAPGLAFLVAPGVRAALLAVALLAAAAAAASLWRLGDRRSAAEVGLLVGVFAVTPPLIAFAAYFGAWHAARHVARLLSADPANAAPLAGGRLGRPLARFAKQAALPTLASVTVLGLLWWGAGGAEGFVAAHLGLIAALTMPHVAVVAALDRTESRRA